MHKWKLYVWICCESDLTLILVSFQSGGFVYALLILVRTGASWCTLCMRNISYPLLHPTSLLPPGTVSASPALPVQHPRQCPPLTPCVSARQLCPGLGVPQQERGCSPAKLLQEYVSSKGTSHTHVSHGHIFSVADLSLPVPK